MRKQMSLIIGIMVVTLIVTFSLTCSSGEDEAELPEYINNVDVFVELGPSSDLTDIGRNDLFFTLRNSGNKAIQVLKGNIVFYIIEGEKSVV